MKHAHRIVLLSILLLASLAGPALAGDGAPTNRLASDTVGLVFGAASLTYERSLNARVSVLANIGGIRVPDEDLLAGWGGLGGAYYITGNAPEGLFVYAMVIGGSASCCDDRGGPMLGVRGQFGYNWIASSGLALGASGGLQFFTVDAAEKTILDGATPAFELSIGYAW